VGSAISDFAVFCCLENYGIFQKMSMRMKMMLLLLLLFLGSLSDLSEGFQSPVHNSLAASAEFHYRAISSISTKSLSTTTRTTISLTKISSNTLSVQRRSKATIIRLLPAVQLQSKPNDDDDDDFSKSSSAVKINPIALPFLVLIGADLLLNIAFILKRTLEFAVTGQAPSTETWW
jgi:hypothetical protein